MKRSTNTSCISRLLCMSSKAGCRAMRLSSGPLKIIAENGTHVRRRIIFPE